MRKRIAMFLTLFAVAIAFVAIAPMAHAGIIVTVGKPAPEDQSKKTRPGMPGYTSGDPRATAGNTGTSAATSTSPSCAPGATSCTQTIDPNTGLPADWKCTPIGGGMLYCENPAAGGAAPGEGGEGYYDPEDYDDEMLDDGEEMQAFGCAGGAGATSGILGIVGAIGGLIVMVRARRR